MLMSLMVLTINFSKGINNYAISVCSLLFSTTQTSIPKSKLEQQTCLFGPAKMEICPKQYYVWTIFKKTDYDFLAWVK